MIKIGILGDIGSGKSYVAQNFGYPVFNADSEVAKLFKSKIKYLPHRKGERFASALSDMSLSNKVYKNFGKISLKKYIDNFTRKYNPDL